jgi:hypothetical protein
MRRKWMTGAISALPLGLGAASAANIQGARVIDPKAEVKVAYSNSRTA